MKFDGSTWGNVGNAGFSAGWACYTSLAFSPIGQPYVAYMDYGNSLKATVMKFDGTNWINVGNAGFSDGEADFTNLGFSPSGQPYVAYKDIGNYGKTTVMKYDSIHLGINELKESRVSLYPNPASEYVTIRIAAPVTSQLTISNINGEELITRQITQPKTQLDISSLPSGVYFVRLTSEKSVVTGKIIKQ
jgi:hypothetical protein